MNNLVRDAAYIHYAANKARVQNAMKRLDESTNVLTEEQINQIILEEFNASAILEKIKQIFSNMTKKFVEYTKNQIQKRHDAEYLNAIKGKIVDVVNKNQNIANIPLEFREYWNGIPKIDNAGNEIFSKLNGLYNTAKADNKETCIANIQKGIMADFNPQGQIKFDQFCMNYFQGGSGTSEIKKTSVGQISGQLNGIVDWCIAYPNKVNDVQRDVDNYMALIAKAVQNIDTSGVSVGQSAPAGAPQQKASNESTNFSKADIHHKAYKYKNILESVFNEENETNDTKTAPAATATNSAQNAQSGNSTNTNGSNPMTSSQNAHGAVVDQQAASEAHKKDASFGIYMGAVQNVVMAVLNARLKSVNIIYNDYIDILQAICPRKDYVQTAQQPNQGQAAAQPAGGNPQQPAPGQGGNG